jgi:pimeloyl-ACP methyl ester carboxylesterase
MQHMITRTLLGLALVSSAAAQEHQHPPSQPTAPESAAVTPLYDNLGTLEHPITTQSPVAQQYFNQGLRLTYAFNHNEAIKSFREGIKHDSTCAMCYWGVAYALGPNINLPMDTSLVKPAWEAVQLALKYSSGTTPKERAYIEALSKRYSPDPAANRAALDSAYAEAMRLVAYAYNKADDAATLYAEALMDLRPWNYWTNGGKPKAPSTLEQLAVLEKVVQRNPNHPGACHFYIHAIEASNEVRKALPCAERLVGLMPGAGHLVHMPTHVNIRLGQWELAADRNFHAVHADEQFISERKPTGVYPMAYYPHNYHMMWYALNMLGRSEEAIKAAQGVVKNVPAEVVRQAPPLEYFSPTVLYTLARFSRWDEILRQPAPEKDLRYTTGVWHYVRGLAYTGQGRLDEAARERDSVAAIAQATPAEAYANLNSVKSLLAIAQSHLEGELAAKQGKTAEAVKHLNRAIAGEDDLTYDEPPPWYMPIRQRLGAVLLEAGRPVQAEKAFRADLVRRPENGWSLNGLAKSLKAQGRNKEAASVEARFKKAWHKADVQISSSGWAGPTGMHLGHVKLPTGVSLHYAQQGDPAAPPVILLHGYSDSWFSYSRVLPSLGEKYRVYAPDLRGHGDSDRPAGGYSMRALAADVVAFMDAKGLKKAAIVGHSMGSFVAQQVALAAPNRVTHLVLISSTTTPRNIVGIGELERAVNSLSDPVSAVFVRDFQYSTVQQPVPAEFMERAIEESLKLPARVWRSLMSGLLATDTASGLASHRIPTLLIWGDRDAGFPRSEQDALVAMLPGTILEVYPGTGHAPHWEQPDRLAKDLERFLSAHRVS